MDITENFITVRGLSVELFTAIPHIAKLEQSLLIYISGTGAGRYGKLHLLT
jgi:hypothetical protein